MLAKRPFSFLHQSRSQSDGTILFS
jgi:hypothetical protein